MIKYRLYCPDCETTYDSWFRNSVTYDCLKKNGILFCDYCGSSEVSKALMAPNVNTDKGLTEEQKTVKMHYGEEYVDMLHKYIEQNFTDVGRDFPDEARAMHYGISDRDPNEGIYGEVSGNDIRDLVNEGIPVTAIPNKKPDT